MLEVKEMPQEQESEKRLKIGQPLEGLNMKELGKINPWYMNSRLIVIIALIAAGAAAALLGPVWLKVCGVVLLGLMYAHAVELQHQCLHNTAYQNNSWNRFVGVLLGLPTLVSHSDYQLQHMRHHRLLGTNNDREFFNYGYDRLSLRTFIPHLLMVRHYRDVAGFIARAIFGGFKRDAKPEVEAKIRNEYRLMFLFLVGMAIVTIVFRTDLFLWLWALPMLVAIPAHALIELPEHIGCDLSTTNVLINTRSIKAGFLASWFVHGNNYHVEHHWLPSVPNNRLAQLHKQVHPDIRNLEISYPSFYFNFLRHLMKGSKLEKLGAHG